MAQTQGVNKDKIDPILLAIDESSVIVAPVEHDILKTY